MPRAYFYLILTNLLWSGNFIVGRATHASIGPLTLSMCRWLVVALLLSPFLYRVIIQKRLSGRQWLQLMFMAVIGVSFYNSLIYIGLQYTTAPNGVLYNSTIPFYIIFINWLIFRQAFASREFLGIVLSIIGVIILVSKASLPNLASMNFSPGDLWIITAALCWGLYTALLPYWRPAQLSGLEFLSVLSAIGVVVLLVIRAVNPFAEPAFAFTPNNLIAVAYVSVGASILAWYCFNEGVKLIGSEKGGQSIHMMPVFVVILAWIFLGESIHGYHLAGAGFILAGLLTANKLSLFKPYQSSG